MALSTVAPLGLRQLKEQRDSRAVNACISTRARSLYITLLSARGDSL